MKYRAMCETTFVVVVIYQTLALSTQCSYAIRDQTVSTKCSYAIRDQTTLGTQFRVSNCSNRGSGHKSFNIILHKIRVHVTEVYHWHVDEFPRRWRHVGIACGKGFSEK